MTDIDIASLRQLSRQEREAIALLLAEKERRRTQRLFFKLFPDEDTQEPDGTTIYARRKYPRHLEFIRAGATYRERCFLAANRVGKTLLGAYETTAHLTGLYPKWWDGRRFDRPISAWVAGKTTDTTRDILQAGLLGEITTTASRKGFTGTGMIPGERVASVVWKRGGSDLADTVRVKHVSGGTSVLGFKSFEQGRGSFEGTAKHVIWADEECPMDVYGECLVRTATTNGILMLTFTPLDGKTDTVRQFESKAIH